MTYQHKELAAGRWKTFSLVEQLAHTGSEVIRALNWQAKGNSSYATGAFERALELLYLTLDDPKNRFRTKEVCRTYEVLVDYFAGNNEYHSTPESLEKYFMYFAYAARRDK